YIGICGSIHDARIKRLSDIKTLMEHDIDNGHLNCIRHNNNKLSKIRVIIERAFGMLKGRFRKFIIYLSYVQSDDNLFSKIEQSSDLVDNTISLDP
ncbi:PREDICTED: uncharacterized protein LOC105620827, partial [Atta cephalotes]|uniref:DDE Tnp4 domain-containing protein n=1 Tax=Atta cephalotes TaxID=12957 RepID=A0A158NJI6_ATTCE